MTGPAYQITTTASQYRVYCWIQSRRNMDAIGKIVGRRVTRKDFATGELVIER